MPEPEPATDEQVEHDEHIVIVGGCGRVGLPLGIALAVRGRTITLYDTDTEAVATVNDDRMPFAEAGAADMLSEAIAAERLTATTDPGCVANADVVIVVVGTPVDRHLNPDQEVVPDTVIGLLPRMHDGQLLILRSTVHPGTTARVERLVAFHGLDIDVVCCPERIAEGAAMVELFTLPQIIGVRRAAVADRVVELFGSLTPDTVVVTPEEAEYAKLITNAWRYIRFAVGNQLWQIVNEAGLDYERIRQAATFGYPRADGLAAAGFAAGPCLLKDTLQLAAAADNQFGLGHAAMLANEGLPLYLVTLLGRRHDLRTKIVGILGMAFKGDSDDPRDSLAFKLHAAFTARAQDVLCSDPHIDDIRFNDLDFVIEHADILIIGAPHQEYADLADKLDVWGPDVVDIWGITGRGVQA